MQFQNVRTWNGAPFEFVCWVRGPFKRRLRRPVLPGDPGCKDPTHLFYVVELDTLPASVQALCRQNYPAKAEIVVCACVGHLIE